MSVYDSGKIEPLAADDIMSLLIRRAADGD